MEVKSLEPYLAEHPFFKGLDQPYIELLAGCAKNMRVDGNMYFFRQNEPADHFYLIRHGKVSVEIPPHAGGEPLVIQTLHEGDVLGWSWLFPPYRWHFDARATELTRVLALDGQCLRGKCDEDPKLGYELMRRFSAIMLDRLSAARIQLLDLYGKGPAPHARRRDPTQSATD